MSEAVIVSAVRTPIGTAFRGTLRDTPAERLAEIIVRESVARAGVDAEVVDDVLLAESLYGGGDLARYAAVAAGMRGVAGVALNRHCAGSLTAVALASASIKSGMDDVLVAGGVMSTSLSPQLTWRVPGSETPYIGMNPTFPHYDGADDDVTISTGWNTAREAGLSREEIDAWALRSHERAVAALDSGVFADELVSVPVVDADGATVSFDADEHPRRGSSLEKLSSLKPLHPEIDGFSITAGNAAGVNDAAAALTLVSEQAAAERGLEGMGRVLAWASIGVDPHRTGMAATEVIPVLLKRAGLTVDDIDLWEINEAFASVPLAAARIHGLDEERVNIYGSGCSLGHPVAATGARMLTTLVHELRRRGGGTAVAAMCAGGGQGSGVVVRVG